MTQLLEPLSFRSTRRVPLLHSGEVHLWLAKLDSHRSEEECLLSPDEHIRASRFHFERDRGRYVAAHLLTRKVLARYAGCGPRDLRLGASQFGKPFIESSLLRFNLSHSENLMLLAVTHRREVGVDIEAIRENVPSEFLAEHYFTPEDQWALRVCPSAERVAKFFEIWTRTEAKLKAEGTGFGGTTTDRERSFTTLTFEPADGFAGAVTVEGTSPQLTCWKWPT